MGEPVRKFDVAVAGSLGLSQRLEERLISDPIKLACDRLKADIGHWFPPPYPSASTCARVCVSCARRDETAHHAGMPPPGSSLATSRWSNRVGRTGRAG